MVLSNVTPISIESHRHPVLFWNRRWVQDVLPLATSLLLHVSIIVIGIGLYKVVQQVSRPNRDQVIIPEMGNVSRVSNIFPSSAAVLPIDPSRPVSQDIDPISQPNGMDTTPRNEFPSGITGDSTANSGTPGFNGPNNQPTGPGGKGFGGSTGVAPWGPPNSTGANIKFIIPGNAQKVVFLCDASGSMLSVFGSLKQQLRQSISEMKIEDGQEFNVIFFSDDNVFPLFRQGMQFATPDNKKLAMDFIDNAVSTGGTQPLPAIKFAMGEKPELIYVLTDGFDQISNFGEVTKAFKDGNKDGKTHIDTIFLQSDEDPKLEAVLQQIAKDGQGTFKKILKSDM